MIYGFIGEIGAGKTYCSVEKVKELKYDGQSCLVIAWADPVKTVLYDAFALQKSGLDTDKYFYVQTECAQCDHYADTDDFIKQNLAHQLRKLCDVLQISHFPPKFERVWEEHGDEFKVLVLECWMQNNYSQNYRKIIQMVGTEIGRGIFPELWTETVMYRAKHALANNICQAVIIDDTRFPNEFEAIARSGCDYIFYVVDCPPSIRAERLGMSRAEIDEFAKHESEAHIPEMKEWIPREQWITNI